MKLLDLRPSISLPGGRYQTLTFLCPRCQQHELQIDIWGGSHGDFEVPANGFPVGHPEVLFKKRLWHAEQDEYRGFDSLTITPSIDRSGLDKCGGWHGFITNGALT